MTQKPSFAVIFRTHFCDEFALRQLARLKTRAGRGHVFVMVDETKGVVDGYESEAKFSVKDQDLVDLGIAKAAEGSMQWYSGDAPLYLFREAHPTFDYYIQAEYDVCVNIDLDRFIDRMSEDAVDVVALTKGERAEDWHWRESCVGAYEATDIKYQLICLSAFSAEALDQLGAGRVAQGAKFRQGLISSWPMCEGFIATEASKLGLRTAELDHFGATKDYNFWPPFLEEAAPERSDFVHPVLDRTRYAGSLLKHPQRVKVSDMLSPFSWFHAKLRRLGFANYVRLLLSSGFRSGLAIAFKQRLGGAGDHSPRLSSVN